MCTAVSQSQGLKENRVHCCIDLRHLRKALDDREHKCEGLAAARPAR